MIIEDSDFSNTLCVRIEHRKLAMDNLIFVKFLIVPEKA